GPVDVLYQDVAQRDQVGIFLKNAEWLRPHSVGYLMVKARSEDVTANPAQVYDDSKAELSAAGLSVLDFRTLSPYQEDHAAVVVQKP
ncbi:MAG: fibrillarin-like rRNA/tRNA 2'-O-methyltransferase, partial [Thermoplasmata archaeon]